MKRGILASLLLAAGWLASATLGATSPTCTLTGEHLMSWPTNNPVWEFCWLRAIDSSAPNGSGLEIRNVYYNGHLVMKRGHIPILDVLYDPRGCGCFRDWLSEEERFQSDNVIFPGYSEPDTPPLTVCDTGGSGGDIGTFYGVAAEKLPDRLILTTQMSAGWYRYTMKWRFYLDGRIEPVMGFAAVNSSCIAFTHRHHAYWRLDFDIDTPNNAVILEQQRPALTHNNGGGAPPTTITTETMHLNTNGTLSWIVMNSVSGRGYSIVPGGEVALPADSFSVGDIWFLKYHDNELDDSGNPGPACAIKFDPYLNGEALADDVVVWYRTGWLHLGDELDDCDMVGPLLSPIGDWSP
jgi:hypothetical protein